MKIIETIAKYVEGSTYDKLPKRVVEQAKLIFMDTLGVGIAGSKTKPGKIFIDVVKSLGGNKQSTLIGDGSMVNCVQAGLVNSYLVDVMDFEETYLGLCHPNASVVPAALAVGEYVKATGKEILNSIVVGNEIATRIGLAIHPSRERMESGVSAYTWHCFGAVSAACKLLRLDKRQMMDAFGFTGSSSSLPTLITRWGRPLPWVKNNFQRQTEAGILGALMAQQGFLGPIDMLDSDVGFWRMAGSDRCDRKRMIEGLGEEYEILKVSLKPYPACRWIHATLDAARDLVEKHPIKPEEIDQIKVVSASILKEWNDCHPASLVDAEFSVPYSVVMLILGYKPGLEWFDERVMRDPKVLSLAEKVSLESSEREDQIFYQSTVNMASASVEIRLKNGDTFRKRIEVEKEPLRGSPEKPIDAVQKFRECAESAGMAKQQSEKIITLINHLDHLERISDLGALLKIS